MVLPSTSSASHSCWFTLPVEIQLTITQLLDINTLLSLCLVSRYNHTLCLPAIYNSVTISTFSRLQHFLDHVPVDHASHIRALDISTDAASSSNAISQTACSDALSRILSLAPRLRSLSLRLSTDLSPLAIPSFSALEHLTDLAVEPCRNVIQTKLSEHTVVAIARALPNLKSLSITRIARATPSWPLDAWRDGSTRRPPPTSVADGYPGGPHSSPATLPSLFSIPTLRHLAIHNTSLGDPLFASPDLPVSCQLESIEIGAFESASPSENARWCSHVLQRVGSHLRSVELSSGVACTAERLSLPALERARLTPLFSPSHLPSTLRVLAAAGGSLRHIHVECLTVDLEDVCEELSECVEHVNGGPYNLRLRVFPALEGDVLAVPPVTSDCVPVTSLDKNAQDALSRLEDAFSSAGTPISIVGSNAPQQADEEQDWDDLTVVDESAVSMEMKGAVIGEDPWTQAGVW
ncbi:hypothetical protein F5148DRAFT_1146700 [Russula earlei]|uniref:Uncharacterized protein n=1 Tax=Russula earlei TaxID=71964 RepID=A0ACC0UKC5_9AGAM|nr:hypothetical protein F5148DRAFT_1146700 [Russula earlei]